AQGTVQAGQTERLNITLQPGAVIAHAFVIHFWFDKAFVEPCMLEVLKAAGQYASSHSNEKLLIVGHTDLAGTSEYNQYLSERRARAVYAVLTHDQDTRGAVAEWSALRKPATGLLGLEDTWSVREYQYMLQALDFYSGNADGIAGSQTAAAIEAFRGTKGLPAGDTVDDAFWTALITDYLASARASVPRSQFLPNCPGEILKWLGCGEQAPVKNTQDAWRPNRRVELLFVAAQKLACQEPQPKTWNLLPQAGGGTGWCLGPGNTDDLYCFATRDAQQKDKWLVQPAEAGTVMVSGSIKHADGSPVANTGYVLIAPDGEDMDGEVPAGASHGRPIPGVTGADGAFSYPNKQKGAGIYVLQVRAPVLAWLSGQTEQSAKGNEVCRRLAGPTPLDVIIRP
ncbi:MAG: OmpA family protein, partial [Chloroflexota bacterium]|nr:OmpA family protein [Chloroflexota bacterium]